MAFVLLMYQPACQGWEQLGLSIPEDPDGALSTPQVPPGTIMKKTFLCSVSMHEGQRDRVLGHRPLEDAEGPHGQ